MRWTTLAISIVVLSSAIVSASEPSTGDVNRWIADLNHDDHAKRAAATEQLVEAGPEAVAALVELLDSKDLETAWRARDVLQGMAKGKEEAKRGVIAALKRSGHLKIVRAIQRPPVSQVPVSVYGFGGFGYSGGFYSGSRLMTLEGVSSSGLRYELLIKTGEARPSDR